MELLASVLTLSKRDLEIAQELPFFVGMDSTITVDP